MTLAILLIVITLISMGQELVSYHFLVQGNYYVQAAEKVKDRPETDRQDYYTRALSAYKRSIGIRSATAPTYNSLGVVSDQLGQYENAIEYYQKAWHEDPGNETHLPQQYCIGLRSLGRRPPAGAGRSQSWRCRRAGDGSPRPVRSGGGDL